jgi:hypothetical protein
MSAWSLQYRGGPVITGLFLDLDDTIIDNRTAMVAAVAAPWPHPGLAVHHAAGAHSQRPTRGVKLESPG